MKQTKDLEIQLHVANREQIETDTKINNLLKQQQESKSALTKINRSSLTEISTYNHPQPVFIACLKVLCIVLECPPDEQHASKYDPEGVFYAAKKKLLLDSFNLLKMLSGFDRNTLTQEKLDKLCQIVAQAELTADRVHRTSVALGNVAHWLIALLQARQIEFELEPLLETADVRKQLIESLPGQIDQLKSELRQVLIDIEDLTNAPPVQTVVVDDTLILSNGNKTQSEISQGLQKKATTNSKMILPIHSLY